MKTKENVEFANKARKILLDYLPYGKSLEASVDEEVISRIVESFISLSWTELKGIDPSFGNSLRKVFENCMLKPALGLSGKDYDTTTQKILAYCDVMKENGLGLDDDDANNMINFWKNSSRSSHTHDKRDFYKNLWLPFLRIIDVVYKVRLNPRTELKFDPFNDELFKAIVGTETKNQEITEGFIKYISSEEYEKQIDQIKTTSRQIVPSGKKYWGIDLGTNNSAISYYISSGVYGTIKFNDKDSISSAVLIDKNTGDAAAITKFDFAAASDLLNSSNKIVVSGWKVEKMDGNEAHHPYFDKYEYKNLERITPVYLSSLIVDKLITTAEDVSGEKITELVVTVPANFTQIGVENTRTAVLMARPSLSKKDVHVFQEPVAAMFSEMRNESELKQEVEGVLDRAALFSVFDMGAGTTDVSLISRRTTNEGKISIKDKFLSKNVHLELKGNAGFPVAGREVDEMILDKYISPELLRIKEITVDDLIDGHDSDFEKRKEREYWTKFAETIKLSAELSSGKDYSFKRDVKINGEPNYLSIQIKYEDFRKDVFSLISGAIEKIRESAIRSNQDISDIEKFILAGGSSQASWIAESIAEEYPVLAQRMSNVNPHWAISLGAAIFGKVQDSIKKNIVVDSFVQTHEENTKIIELDSKTLNNYGLVLSAGDVSWMIEAGTTIPSKSIEREFKFVGNDTQYEIQIVEADKKYPYKYMAKLISSFKVIRRGVDEFSLQMSYQGDKFKIKIVQGEHIDEYEVQPYSKSFSQEFDKFVKRRVEEYSKANYNLTKNSIKDFDLTLEKMESHPKNNIRDSHKDLVKFKEFLTDEQKQIIITFMKKI